MGAHCNRKIDWEIANLDGNLFPMATRLRPEPLPLDPRILLAGTDFERPPIQAPAANAPPTPFELAVEKALARAPGKEPRIAEDPAAANDAHAAHDTADDADDDHADDDHADEDHAEEATRPVEVAVHAPTRSSLKPVYTIAAGLTGGVLLGAVWAMAFATKTSEPVAAAPAAPAEPALIAQDSTPAAEPPIAGPASTLASFDASNDVSLDAVPVNAVSDRPSAPQAEPRALAAAPRPSPAQIAALEAPAKGEPQGLEALAARPTGVDRAAAALAIAIAGRSASSCLDAGDARRSMPVAVTFAPSGRVTSARIEGGPFVGSETGSCIARALRSAKVGAFDGEPVTIHGSVQLH